MIKESDISLAVITRNAAKELPAMLDSVNGLCREIIVVDDCSTDSTAETARKYGAKIYVRHDRDLGRQRFFSLERAKGPWILILDSDEQLSKKLRNEIIQLVRSKKIDQYDGYFIRFQTHLFGKPLRYGGEAYKKLILFKKSKATIEPAFVHEKFLVRGKISALKNTALHYSYTSLGQIYAKFTDYALREAEQKYKRHENSSMKKIFLYPPHLFWARYINVKGYKDGLPRILLDLGFAYMEALTYILLFQKNIRHEK